MLTYSNLKVFRDVQQSSYYIIPSFKHKVLMSFFGLIFSISHKQMTHSNLIAGARDY